MGKSNHELGELGNGCYTIHFPPGKRLDVGTEGTRLTASESLLLEFGTTGESWEAVQGILFERNPG
jgi:hypothetical protein